MRPRPKDDKVLRLALRQTLLPILCRQPALGLERVGLGVACRVVQTVPERRNDHGVLGDGIFGGDGESFGGEVGNL